jgi:hypothetical protein
MRSTVPRLRNFTHRWMEEEDKNEDDAEEEKEH